MFSLEVKIFLFNSNKIDCLFGVFHPTQYSYPIHSYEDVDITGEELKILKHAFKIWDSHLRRPLTLTSVAERLAEELSLPFFTIDIGLSRLGFEHPTFSMQSKRSNRLRHCRGLNAVDCVIQKRYISKTVIPLTYQYTVYIHVYSDSCSS